MPDFDKDLNPILLNTDTNPINLPNPATPVELNLADLGGRRGPAASATDSFFGNGPVVSNMLPTVSAKELYDNRRYGIYSADTIDIEDQKAYAQSNWNKATNGVLKGLNLAATTVAGSFGMLYGTGKWALGGKFSDIWDNPVMRDLDEWNNEVDQVYLPNYYTNVENDASWYSTDNWFKANWVFDKLIKNSGFAVGAMVTGNIANAGLLRAGAALGRYATAGAVAAEASQGFKLFTPLLKNAARAFSAGKNLEAAAVLEKELSSIADITANSSKLAEIAKQTSSKFAKFGDTGRRTLVAAYSSAGESSFEALSTSNEFRNNLISEYKDTHGGIEPTGGDLQTINEKAADVGKVSFLGNLALLGVTEFVQLPKLLGSTYSSSKQAANSLLGKVDDVILKDSKYIAAPKSVTKFGKLYDKVVGVGKYAVDIKEAGQEVGQYALQVGTQNYFNKANETGNADAWVDGFLYGFGGTNKEGEGVGALVSKEGAESALMGGLTGGLMQTRGTFLEDRATKSNTQKLISQLNTVPSFQKAFKERLDAANRGIVLQQQQQSAVIQGDKLEAKDLDSDMLHNYLAPRIKYGRFDMVMDDIADLKAQAMTKGGLAALKEEGMANINDTVDSYLARITSIENTAKAIDNLYKSTNLRFSGEVDENGKRLYPEEVIDRMIYAASKVADYDLRIPQVAANLANSGISIDEALLASVTGSSEEAKKAEEAVISKINELNSTNADELKSEFKQVVELNLRRKKFLDEYNEIKEKPQEYTPPEITEEEKKLIEEEAAGVPKKLLRIRTKDGDEDLEIGTEYFLGRLTKKDKDNNPVYGFPRITILGETEKGLVQVKDINGKIHFLSKADIATFKLGKVSDTLNNKKAKWFLENVNNQFAMKRRGKKDPYIGRLEYSPKDRILNFIYTDDAGRQQVKEVTSEQFVARDGYANGIITKVGEYTVSEEVALEEFQNEEDDRRKAKLTNRLNIINNIYQKTKASLEEVNKKLDANKKKIEDAEEALDNVNKTAKGLPRKSFTKAIRATIDSLVNIKKTLEDENTELENQQDELETNIAYFRDMMDNLGELPNERGIIDELRDDVNILQELLDHTADAIKTGKSLLESVEAALIKALSAFNDFVIKLKEDNPKTPLFIQQFQERIEKFLGEEGARLFVEQKLGYTEAVLDLEDQMDTFKDELKIPQLTNKVEKLKEQLSELQSGIKDLQDEHRAKAIVLSAFEDAAERYRAQKSEEDRMRNNEALMGELMGSADPGLQTRVYDKAYEPESKKSDPAVVLSTITPSKSDQPHVKRANLFGINFGKFTEAKKNKTKGVVITSKNEADYGLAGLTQHLKDVSDVPEEEKAKIDPKETVVFLVVAETKSGSYRPVDVNGDVIEDSGETITFDNAIYQTFPDPKLQWSAQYNNQSMFREGEREDRQATIDYYKKEYSEWHADALANPSNAPRSFEASFGTPTIVTRKDENGKDVKDYDASTSVEEAGLITEAELRTRPVIYIPTTNKVVSQGSTFFDSPLGRPFLSLRNAYVKLQNRRLTKKEAETIYEAIYRLSVDVYKHGNAKSDESRRLFNWLKSIVYWGTPKNATGYNSIFFERTDEGLMLFISGKGKSFPFTPTKIIDNKAEILAGIGLMYNNINYTMVSPDSTAKLWKEPYEEIVSISDDGKIEKRDWPNYQTYLLSREGREASEPLPLSTQIVPYKEDAPNRDGVYFTLTDTADTQRYSNPPKPAVVTAAPATLSPVAPGAALPSATAPTVIAPTVSAAPVVTAAPAGEYKFDNSVEEIPITNADGVLIGNATFELDLDEFEKSNGDAGFFISALPDGIKELMERTKSKGDKLSEEDARNVIQKYVSSKIRPLANARIAAKNAAKELAALEEEERLAAEKAGEAPGSTDAKSGVEADVLKILNRYAEPRNNETEYQGDEGYEPAEIYKDDSTVGKIIKALNSLPPVAYNLTSNSILEFKNKIKELLEDMDLKDISDDIISNIDKLINEELSQLDKEKVAIESSAKDVAETAEPVVETSKTVPLTAAEQALIDMQMDDAEVSKPMRKIIQEQLRKFKPENWKQVEAWLKANYPNIPVYRVKNVIQGINGAQGWGMFKDGAIYIYENAEVGTVYHEVFHSVWRTFSDSIDELLIMSEFRNRQGSFVDRPTGQIVKYSEATDIQIEEQLAEEFRDYVQYKKIPPKPASGRPYIVKLFLDLVNFIKEFFVGRKASTNTEKLFEKIGTGYYKQFNSNEYSLAFAKKGIIDIEEAYASSDSAFRIKDIPADQVHDIMQEMTYATLTGLITDNKSLFNVAKLNKEDLYKRLLENQQKKALLPAKIAKDEIKAKKITPEQAEPTISKALSLWKKITDEWSEIREKHEEYLKTYDVEFDENDNVIINDEDNSGKEAYQDARKIDVFKKANSAIKLLLSTIPIVDEAGDFVPSSVNGARLLPTSKVFMALMNNLHTSANLDVMMERLREMAKSDPNYRTLYARLTNTSYITNTNDFSSINEVHDGQLLSAFWRVFKKQNPDVKNVYIFENGDIEIGDSNLASAARQISKEYVEAFKKMITEKNPYFEYSTSKMAYIGLADGTKAIREAFKKAKTNSDTLDIMISFLSSMGIEFKKDEIVKLPGDKQDAFKFAVNGILSSIEQAKSVATATGKVLDLEGRFMNLSTIRAAINNPEFDSTFFNVKGERMQAFIGTNAASDLFEALSRLSNKKELLGTPYAYLLNDESSQFSVIIDKMFDSKTGDRIDGSEDLMRVGYADGTVNQETGKKKESSSLNSKERLIQEINLNLKGWYYNLVPGDASIEWMTKMGNHVSAERLLSGFGDVHRIFEGYFLSELALSRANRPIVSLDGKRNTKDLRFLKPILDNYDKELHNEIINATGTEVDVYKRFKGKINNAVEAFITKESASLKNSFREYGMLTFIAEKGYQLDSIGVAQTKDISEGTLNRQLNAISINFIINNIEFHKILYSDPYQYSDELKRTKHFNSPHQAIVNGSVNMNNAYQKIWNKNYKPGDIGYDDFTDDFFRTATLEDVIGRSDLKDYGTYEETDGGGVILMKALRQFKIRAGEWNDDNELQYEYDIAYEKVVKGEGLSEEEKAEKRLTLTPKEEAFDIRKFENQNGSVSYIGNNPDVKSTYTPIKPIVAGNKGNGRMYNDVLLDKFALYPLSFRIMHTLNPNSNAVRQYDKMTKENIDYAVFATGRKVGAEALNPIYNPIDGSFNNDEYEGIINVPFGIMSIQSEVPSKDTIDVSRGSQVTKLVTMDYMEAGVPVDFEIKDAKGNIITDFTKKYAAWFDLKTEEAREAASPIYKEIRNNQMLLEELMEKGYVQLLKNLGIEETIVNGRKEFNITDFSKAAETLRDEILKREVNDNINDALAGFLKGETVLEATPAYQQVRNILYSIADKNVISPKMPGGLKVQISSTFLESVKAKPIEFTDKKGATKYSYESSTLDFYKDEDGKRVCEIIVGRWFDSDMTDADLLKYLNDTDEGKKILAGVAYRIPTQKQNSIDVFRIKQFMPREFGDSVIVPSALVKKVGSDFDIDKLSLYFKNIFIGKDGKPKLIKFLTDENSTAKERYVHWVRENSNRDTRKYVKFLSRGLVQNLRANFEIELAKINAKYQIIRAERKEALFQDMVENMKSEKNNVLPFQDSYMKELFETGRKVFWRMTEGSTDKFFEVRDDIRRKNIKGPEEIRRYLSLAVGMLQNDTTEEEDINKLEALVKIYNEELRVMGLTDESIKNITKNAIEQFRKNKDALGNALRLEKAPEFAVVDEVYEEAKSEVAFEVFSEIANKDGLQTFKEFQTKSLYEQNVKKALQNAYIESMQNLITHPKNFTRLTTPNSADQLKDLAKKVTKKLGFEEFDYASTGNMLSRKFMTRLRHAFVTGKYAIGIAAVNQTNHSLNQRQPIYVDFDRFDNVSDTDKLWLTGGTGNQEDLRVKFKNFNKLTVNGKVVATLSMIKNADKSKKYPDGQDISDIIGQFIDGYVDISKGPWIMELGANPNVASTFLFLAKIGVPIDQVAYFMNQPIIRDYLRSIENAGYSYLFIDQYVNNTKAKYKTTSEVKFDEIPSATKLYETIGAKELTPEQNAEQQFILDEFLKYAKMAEHMFQVTQASNFDTATFNDPYLVFKKIMQLIKARKSIISSVDKLLDNSFIGKMSSYIYDIRDAFAEILKSDNPTVRNIIQDVLEDYVDMNDRDFVRIAQKAVNDLFDWAVQVDIKLNAHVRSILLGTDTAYSAARQIYDIIKPIQDNPGHSLHHNVVVQNLVPRFAEKTGQVNNLKIKNSANKVYDQNQMIYAFQELQKHLDLTDKTLYKKLIALSVLQSGLTSSPISFTSLLPYEDFKGVYNKTLSTLETFPDLANFAKLNVFQRNNWNNDEIVPYKKGKMQYSEMYNSRYYRELSFGDVANLNKDIMSKKIPQVIKLSALSRESNNDIITYSWEVDPEVTADDRKIGIMKSSQKKLQMRKEGNTSFIKKGLFKKVMIGDEPLIHPTEKGNPQYIYVMINPWGDSFRANEFYDTARKSIVENGYEKVDKEVDDATIVAYFQPSTKSNSSITVTSTPVQITPTAVSGPSSETKINIYAGTGENADLSNFANRPFKLGDGVTYPTVEHAFQLEKLQYSNAYTEDQIENIVKDMNTKSAAQVKAFGKTIKGLDVKMWNEDASIIMKDLIKQSFQANPDALAKLLATGNATLTHTQDKGKWGTEFPKLLMEVRKELRPAQAPVANGDAASLKAQIAELEQKKKTKGLSSAEVATLMELETKLGKIQENNC